MFRALAVSSTFALLGCTVPRRPRRTRTSPEAVYKHGPDSQEQDGVPQGKVIDMSSGRARSSPAPSATTGSTSRPSTTARRPPASWSSRTAAYVNRKGDFRVPVVFDNLIHKKEMPVTIGIFINPGTCPAERQGRQGARATAASNTTRCRDQYATFLEKEILPEVGKTYKLRKDAAGRAIGGISSGGICAFTVAWERPDLFSKVLQPRRQLHQHPRRRRLSGHDPQDREEADPRLPAGRRRTTSTTCTATGRWRTSRWRRR